MSILVKRNKEQKNEQLAINWCFIVLERNTCSIYEAETKAYHT